MAWIPRLLAEAYLTQYSIPAFLCPIVLRLVLRRGRICQSRLQTRSLQLQTADTPRKALPLPSHLISLPRTCPGCGAFTQITNPHKAGFYNLKRKSVNAFLAQQGLESRDGDSTTRNPDLGLAETRVLRDLDCNRRLPHISVDLSKASIQTPICNRCHDLLHHNSGASIEHPTLQSIREIISESPHKYNHIYHVLDAADFPLSLIPQLQRQLSLTRQRSRNRRAKSSRFYHGRKAELSFIITRSDLLAPKKDQVDKLMPYLIGVLRDALGSSAKDVRLGNIHCVSSKRGWWTANLKEDIWKRGGGGWMVGKVNVGKSNLLECVFPKGRNEKANFTSLRGNILQGEIQSGTVENQTSISPDLEHDLLQEDALLPPAPVEQAFPVMPIVSLLPGTTASPIRLPFGGGRGELIDLPGLRRSDLETYVADEHKSELVMQQRLRPEQYVLKPGQSLLLGNLIRITPKTPEATVLAYPYVPFPGHVTSTEKAIRIHTQQRDSCIPSLAKRGVGSSMSSAGAFQLKWDVTKKRAGPLTSQMAVGLKAEVLPFKVFSTDLLIEGCGWVELVAQVQKRDLISLDNKNDRAIREHFPEVEVFSPEGRHIGARQPMGAWLLGGRKPNSRRVRPRRSMKGVKRRTRLEARREHSGGEATRN